jgi:hypothetical protein
MDTLTSDRDMKITLLLGGLSLIGMLAEVASEYGQFGPWANLGALACVVSLLIFLVCKYLPKIDRDRAKERADHIASMDRMADRFERREKSRDEALEHLTAKIYELNVTCTRHQARGNHAVAENQGD